MSSPYQIAIQSLNSLRVSSIGAAADMLWVHFGEFRTVPTRDGLTKEVGEWALHLQCPWRFVRNGKIILGSSDFYYQAEDGEPLKRDSNSKSLFSLKAARLNQYLHSEVVGIVDIHLSGAGAFELRMGSGVVFSVMPVESLEVSDAESWRLFQPSTDLPHFVYPEDDQQTEHANAGNPRSAGA